MDSKQKHFFNRAAFGLSPDIVSSDVANAMGLLVNSGNHQINVVTNPAEDQMFNKEKVERKELRELLKNALLLLNTKWIGQMEDPTLAIREKMTLFWHDHFSCRVRNPFLMQQQNNTIRNHALGKFGDLLMAVSKDPAMLQFLNNQQNKKDSPNENFAREVMELFTLGRGNYTEDDIKNAAKAFTGWGFNPMKGEFVFRERVHDSGSKTFRGKTGNFSGEDIISMILEDRQTALFITQKIWQTFVHPSEIHGDILKALATDFYTSDYDIALLMKNIFDSKWFYEERYRGIRIKSPIELIVGMKVHTSGSFNNPGNLLFLQKVLGQVLFQPPNVGGWPLDKEWIDSSSLAFRMSLPAVLLRDSETQIEAKDDGDVNNVTNTFDKAGKISFSANWQKLSDLFLKSTVSASVQAIGDFILAKPASAANVKIIRDFAEDSKEDPEFIKKVFIGYMSLPDYQLC